MSAVALRFYNYAAARRHGRKFSWVHWLISRRSKPRTHVEFQWDPESGGMSFSSTLQDKEHGGRFKDIEYTKAAEHWDTLYFVVPDRAARGALYEAEGIDGKPYDLFGLLSFSTKWAIIRGSKEGYWCSEAVAILAIAAGIYDGPTEITPEALFAALKDKADRIELCEKGVA
jgi:hypothetical protein